jgi:hypothetical protein
MPPRNLSTGTLPMYAMLFRSSCSNWPGWKRILKGREQVARHGPRNDIILERWMY